MDHPPRHPIASPAASGEAERHIPAPAPRRMLSKAPGLSVGSLFNFRTCPGVADPARAIPRSTGRAGQPLDQCRDGHVLVQARYHSTVVTFSTESEDGEFGEIESAETARHVSCVAHSSHSGNSLKSLPITACRGSRYPGWLGPSFPYISQ